MVQAAAEIEVDPAPEWVLRVLSGGQRGAHIALSPARYTIGSGKNCAIVLNGRDIEAEHLEIFFAEGQCSILRHSGKIFAGGQRVEGEAVDLNPFEVFVLGETALAYGSSDGSWPGEKQVAEALAACTTLESPEPPVPPAPPASEVIGQPRAPALPRRTGTKLTAGLLALLFPASLAMLAASLSPQWAALTGSGQETRPPESRLPDLIAGDPAFAHVRWSATPGAGAAQYALKGHVVRSSDLNRLAALAARLGADMQVASLEKMRRSLEVLLPLYGPSMGFQLTPGKGDAVSLQIEGVVRAASQIGDLRKTIRRDLPAISAIHMKVIAQNEALHIIRSTLAGTPRLAGLEVSADNAEVTISGSLLGNFREQWRRTETRLISLLPRGAIVHRVIHFGPIFAGRIESVLIGARTHIRLAADGGGSIIYTRGESIPGGLVIETIRPDALTLKDRQATYIYPILP